MSLLTELLIHQKKRDDYEVKLIIDYLERFPNFSFKSSRLSNRLDLNPTRTSKVLRRLYRDGILDRRCRRNGKGLVCFYKYKKND